MKAQDSRRRYTFALTNFADESQAGIPPKERTYNPDPVDSPTEEIYNEGAAVAPAAVQQIAAGGSREALLAAAGTAVAAVPGGVLYEIEWKGWNEYWDTQVSAADGTLYKLKVSGDGSTIFQGPIVKQSKKVTKQALRAERVAQVSFDYAHAIEVAMAAYPNCLLVEVEIGSSKNRVVWKVELITAQNVRRKIRVDVATKELVADKIAD